MQLFLQAAVLIDLLGGGITGYFTNKAAIKMLFKKYGPFGGVILKTREEFIEKISQLIERDIINGHTLEKELLKEDFWEEFNKIVENFFRIYLYKNTPEITLDQIPGMGQSLENLYAFYKINCRDFISEIYDPLLAKDILSERQLEKIVDTLFDGSIKLLKRSYILEDYIRCISKVEISDLITEPVIKNTIENIIVLTGDLRSKYDSDFDQLLSELSSTLNINAIIKLLEDNLKERPLKDLLGAENTEELLKRITNFIKSTEGRRFITTLISGFWKILRETELTLFDLLGEEIGSNLELFLQRKISLIGDWIRENKKEILELLQDAINDTLAEESESLKGRIKKWLYNLFFQGDFSGKNDLISKMINSDPSDISNKIIGFLKANSIKDLLDLIEEKKPIEIDKFINFLLNNLEGIIDKIGPSILERKIGEITGFELSSFFENKLKNIIKERFIYSPEAAARLQRKAFASSQAKLNDLFTEKELVGFKNKIIKILEEKKDGIKEPIFEAVEKYLSKIITKENLDIIFSYSDRMLKRQINSLKERRITYFYHSLNNREGIYSDLTTYMLNLINENLPEILEGRIASTISDNLSRLAEEDVRAMVEDFMGKELKPITYFGAGLGMLFAILLYIFQSILGLEPETRLPLSLIIYGFTGYITNVIALRMIFKPYNEKKIFGLKIPFTPGVVAREKPRFASSMGRFVKEELLNKESVERIFKEKREKIEARSRERLSRDNFSILAEFLNNNADYLTKHFFEFLGRNREQLIDKFIVEIGEIELSQFDFNPVLTYLKNNKGRFREYINTYLDNFLVSDKPLETVLPDFIKEAIFKQIDKHTAEMITELIDITGDYSRVKEILLYYTDKMDDYLDQRLADLIPEQVREELVRLINDYFENGLRAEEFRKKFPLELTTDELINGHLFINPERFTGFIIEGVLGLLSEKRSEIKNWLITYVKSAGGFLYLALNFLDIDQTLGKIVDELIDNKLPRFISSRQDELRELSLNLLKWPICISGEAGDEIIAHLLKSGFLARNINNLFDSLSQIKTGSLLRLINIDSFSELLLLFTAEIQTLQKAFKNELEMNKEEITRMVSGVLKNIFRDLILSGEISRITGGIKAEEIARSIDKIITGETFSTCLARFLEQVSGELKSRKLGEVVELKTLKEDLLLIIKRILDNPAIRDHYFREFEKLIRVFINQLNELLEVKTKDFILDLALKSALDAVENNFLELINSIDLAEVTENEVKAMDPAEIEELFESFAGNYFRKLEAYGWVGSFIGFGVEILKSWPPSSLF